MDPQHHAQVAAERSNWILGMLPPAVSERVRVGCSLVDVPVDQTLVDVGEPIVDVYFPLDAVASLDQVIDPDSDDAMSSPGIALVGSEGIIGLEVIFGAETAINRATVRIGGKFLKVPADTVKQEFLRESALHRVLLRSADALFAQVCGISSCERVHPIQQRLIRWLLLFDDRCDKRELPLKQTSLAQMLAVRRVSISAAAALLQLSGDITYHRGVIVLSDREALESKACNCYRQIKKRFTEHFQLDD